MNPVRLGLIGLGEWPRKAYVPVLEELDTAKVVAVAARSEATREYARERFGDGLTLHDDYRTLLADRSVDAVMLALPNRLHAEALRAALASGKHVFYEPPIGHAEEEINLALDAMAATDRVVQADLELRYLPVIDAVRRLLDAGEVGRPLMAKIHLWCNWGQGTQHQWQEAAERGFFPWLSCWYLDVLDCVFAQPPLRASVTDGHAANGPLTDHGWATLEYAGGGIGEYEFSLVSPDALDIRLDVLGTAGRIEADLCGGTCRWCQATDAWHEARHPASQPSHGFEGMRECLVDFLDAASNPRPVRANVDVARRVHAAMLACMRAESTGLAAP